MIFEIADAVAAAGADEPDRDALRTLIQTLTGSRLHELTKGLRDYRKTGRGKIKDRYTLLLHQFSLFIYIYTEVADLVGNRWRADPNKDQTQRRINTSSKLFNKSIQICLDLLTLMESGSLTSTLNLWRMIYENYVVTLYLLSRGELISEMFNNHEYVDHFNLLSNSDESFNDIKIIVDRLVQKYGKQFKEPYGWAFLEDEEHIVTFSAVRKQTGESVFHPYYRLTSSISHSSSLSVNRSYFTDGKHGNINTIGVFSENIGLPYQLTVRLMNAFVKSFVEYFYPEDDSERETIILSTDFVTQFVIGA